MPTPLFDDYDDVDAPDDEFFADDGSDLTARIRLAQDRGEDFTVPIDLTVLAG